jgi:PTS system mannose-specific IID component
VGGGDVKGALFGAWLRTLLLQASWNHDRMVGVGFAFAVEPLLRRLPGGRDGVRYRNAMQRATQYFNAHPYMTGMAVGAVGRAEHDGVDGDAVRRFRHALIPPLGSIGDRLFWAGVLPSCAAIGLIVAAEVRPLIGIACFLVLYNAAHLVARWWALSSGWRHGPRIASALTARGLQHAQKFVGPVTAILVGLALPIVGQWVAAEFSLRTQLSIGLVGIVGLVLSRWIVPTFGSLRFGLAVGALALLAGWLW